MCNSDFCTTGLAQSRGIVDYLKVAKASSKKISTVGWGKVAFGRPCRIKGRTFSKSFVKEVRVIGDEAVLSYSMPLPPEKVIVEQEVILPTVYYGGRYWI